MEADLQDGGREALSGDGAPGTLLCRLDEIDNPGSKGFENIEGEEPFFVVRHGETVVAYRNSCPHYGAPLDWKPDAFLSVNRDRILCSMHAALFRIEDGVCEMGPCPGQGLEPVKISVEDDKIFINEK